MNIHFASRVCCVIQNVKGNPYKVKERLTDFREDGDALAMTMLSIVFLMSAVLNVIVTIICFIIFGLFYGIVYKITSGSYYEIVSRNN